MKALFATADIKRTVLRQWMMLGLILAGLAAVIGGNLYYDYYRAIATERDRLLAQVRVIDQNLDRQLEATYLGLSRLIKDIPRWRQGKGYTEAATARLVALEEVMPGVRTLTVIDADGIVRLSNRSELVGVDTSSRDYFRKARSDSNAVRMAVTPPFKTVLGNFVINLIQVVRGPQGEFNGIVAAALEPAYFSTLMNSVRYAPDMWSALAHGDGQLFLMVPERPALAGTSLAKPGSFFSRHVNSGLVETVMQGTVYSTGESRMMAQRTIHPEGVPIDSPLVVAVSRDLGAIFAPWWSRLKVQVGVYLFIVMASILGLGLWQKGARRYAEKAEAARLDLAEIHQRFERMAGTVPCVLYDYESDADGHGRFQYLSARCNELLELSADELLDDMGRFWNLVHPADVAHLRDEEAAAQREGRAFLAEVRLIVPSGRQKWVQISALPHVVPLQAAALPTAWSGFILDISERKAAEVSVVQREQQLRTLVASMNDLVVLVDTSGRISEFHWPQDWRGSRPDPDSLMGCDYAAVLPPEVASVFTSAIGALMAGGPPWSIDLTYPLAGQDRRLHATFSALSDGGSWPRGFLCVARDMTDRVAMEDELRRLATTDFLTGVANRRSFVEQMASEVARIRRFGQPGALLMLDIDHFKGVNDRLGHAAGDEVLRHLAQLAVDQLRQVDMFGRLGGEEFGILLPGTDTAGAMEFAERFRRMVEASPAMTTRGPVTFTVSIGVARLDPADTDPDAALARADAGLYKAKESGRNRVEQSD